MEIPKLINNSNYNSQKNILKNNKNSQTTPKINRIKSSYSNRFKISYTPNKLSDYYKSILNFPSNSSENYIGNEYLNNLNENVTKIIKEKNKQNNALIEFINKKNNLNATKIKINPSYSLSPVNKKNNNVNISDTKTQLTSTLNTNFYSLDKYYEGIEKNYSSDKKISNFKLKEIYDYNTINNKLFNQKILPTSKIIIKNINNNSLKLKEKENKNIKYKRLSLMANEILPIKIKNKNLFNKNIFFKENNRTSIKQINSFRLSTGTAIKNLKGTFSQKYILNNELSTARTEIKSSNQNNEILLDKDSNIYKMPENLLEIRNRLNNEILKLSIKSNKNNYNITNDQIIFSLEQTKNSEYTKNIIEKIKIINNYIELLPKEKFISKLNKHRKVFVIIDGTVVFNENIISGEFIDLPTRKYLKSLETKKERLEEFYKFLIICKNTFHLNIPFRSIFLLNGLNVFDLIEIPENEKILFVSHSNIFRGIHLFFDIIDLRKAKEKDFNLLKLNEYKKINDKLKRFRNKKLTTKFKNKILENINTTKIKNKNFKIIKKEKKYFNDSSFTFGITNKNLIEEKYYYFSDDESKRKKIKTLFKEKYPSLLTQLLYFNQNEMEKLMESTKKYKNKKIKKFLKTRQNEETFKGFDILIQNYNNNRAKKNKIKINQHLKCTLTEEEKKIINKKSEFIKILKKLKYLKKFNEYDIDNDLFYGTTDNNIINKNIKEIKQIPRLAGYKVDRYYPDLISLNIPRCLKAFPKLKRSVFYDIFVQFKELLVLCTSINKNLKKVEKGIDFDTFFNCIPQMKTQGKKHALKIYKTLNGINLQCMNWEDYLKGMYSMRSDDINDKIDIFLKIIDADGNGLLSFEEVFDISKESLLRSLGDKNNQEEEENNEESVVNILATYFANLIFQLVEMPIDEEIPMDLIRNKIVEGKEAAGYLEMFICADSFT